MKYFLQFIFFVFLFSCSLKETENKVAGIEVNTDVELDSPCQKEITNQQLRAQKELEINIPVSCDSFKINLPSGGTVTSATLYTDSLLKNEICSTPSFGMKDEKLGHLTISSKTRGKFYLVYGSCHWSSRMWIHLK